MDEWERSFITKSERRRSRSRRRSFLGRVGIVALLSVVIIIGLWLADKASTFMMSSG